MRVDQSTIRRCEQQAQVAPSFVINELYGVPIPRLVFLQFPSLDQSAPQGNVCDVQIGLDRNYPINAFIPSSEKLAKRISLDDFLWLGAQRINAF